MKKFFLLATVCASFSLLAACSTETSNTLTDDLDTNDYTVTEDTADTNGPEYFGSNYPASNTTAKAGETILAPSRAFVDSAIEKGEGKSSFIFYNATMGTPGETYSSINTAFTKDVSMPNALIIPLPAKQTADVGDIVLTWWQSGSGMQRAIVVEGGTPEQPMVRYLDLDLDNPAKNADGSPLAEREEQLKADSFTVIDSDFDIGSSVAYLDEYGSHKHGQVVNMSGDKVLILAWAGMVKVLDKTDVIAIPVEPNFKVGDSVKVPVIGTFKDGVVTEIDATNGRIYVEYDFGGSKKTVGAPYGDVAAENAF